MISTLAISTICRSLIGTTGALELLIPLVVLAEIFGSPVTAISDAAILALCAKVIDSSPHQSPGLLLQHWWSIDNNAALHSLWTIVPHA